MLNPIKALCNKIDAMDVEAPTFLNLGFIPFLGVTVHLYKYYSISKNAESKLNSAESIQKHLKTLGRIQQCLLVSSYCTIGAMLVSVVALASFAGLGASISVTAPLFTGKKFTVGFFSIISFIYISGGTLGCCGLFIIAYIELRKPRYRVREAAYKRINIIETEIGKYRNYTLTEKQKDIIANWNQTLPPLYRIALGIA